MTPDRDSKPLVSIIMSAFNSAPTISDALTSIASQTYNPWELIVCDDASTDDTYKILSKFEQAHPGQVSLLQNDTNSKLAYSLNRCLTHASGDFVARMDADDKCLPNRLEMQVEYLQQNPEVDLVGSAMRRFDITGLHDVVRLEYAPDRNSMIRGVCFAHATIMARTEVFRSLGGYVDVDRTLRCEDLDLWFRFHAKGFTGRNLPEALYLVREDKAAVRRRTLSNRWRAYKTTLVGFQQLGYPRRWYLRPTLDLLKGFVPYHLIDIFRNQQAKVKKTV